MRTPTDRTHRPPLLAPVAWLAAAGLSLSAISLAQDQPAIPPADPPAPEQPAAPGQQPAPAEDDEPELPEAVVLLKDGQRMSGLLIEQNDERVVLQIAGIKSTIKRELVERVWVLPPTMERYRSIRAAINDNDTEQLLRLAEWLRARGKFEPALAEVDHVLSLEPEHPEAKRLRVLIAEQKELDEKARANRQAREADRQPEPDENQAVDPREKQPFPLLSGPQINTIRVYEVDTNDAPRILIDRDTITQLMSEHAGSPLIPATREGREAMYRKRPAEILDIMFRLQARNLYGRVQVLDHPASLQQFRDNVHRGWLVNNCATTRCHGGTEAGRLWLYNRRPNSDETVYTNFLILERSTLPDGTPLINYDEPARSPLLHMGLPREDSLYPHPQVTGPEGRGELWRPVFRGANDRRYRQAIDWIRAMYRPRPDYPVDYTPPRPEGVPEEPPPVDAPPAEENPPR